RASGSSQGMFVRLQPHLRSASGLCGIALLAVSFACLNGTMEFPGYWAVLPPGATALLIFAGPRAFINRAVLSSRPIVFIGLISYPLYLWHWSLLCFVRLIGPSASRLLMGAVLVVAFLFSVATYLYIEVPVRRSPASRQMVAGLCTALLCCGSVG